MKVLVMENEPSLRQMLAYVLERQGVQVEQCASGDLENRMAQGRYDAIVFNARPQGAMRPAGEVACRAGRGTRLICFSSPQDQEAVRPSEVDAHLPFPFSSSELLGALLGMV